MTEPILIVGCARSGTSMVAGIVHLCGAFGGNMSGPNYYNRKGMFENAVIRNKITKPYLRDQDYDPLGQYPLPDTGALWIMRSLRTRVQDIMRTQGWDEESPWFYKGAKLCLVWPAWHYAFPEAKWISVRRRDEDIFQSCLKTGFMRAFDDKEGWQWWIDQHKERFEEMKQSRQVREVWPEKMMNGDYGEMRKVVEWVGLNWKDQEVRDFIEPKLYGSK